MIFLPNKAGGYPGAQTCHNAFLRGDAVFPPFLTPDIIQEKASTATLDQNQRQRRKAGRRAAEVSQIGSREKAGSRFKTNPPTWSVPFDLNQCNFTVSQLQLLGGEQRVDTTVLADAFASLAFDAEGCRLAQSALELAGRDLKLELSLKLHGHIREAIDSPFANYVVQRVIEMLPPSNVQFIVDEVSGSVMNVAQHRYGVRILCRLLEYCPSGMIEELIVEATKHITSLCRHRYGNYLAQHIMDYGTSEQRGAVVKELADDALEYARDRLGSALIQRALVHTEIPERMDLLRQLKQDTAALRQLSSNRFGSKVAKALLDLSGDEVDDVLLHCEKVQ